ncbi:MAG: glycosyltransferase family 1 protein [Parcubacteria group bacterium]|jgi:glycosyltransferase involved in cell wall biosynthesis
MKIGIDARFFGSVGKGLGRYTQKLIEKLEEIDPVNEYFVFLKKENYDEYQPKNSQFKKVLANYHWYSFAEQLFFPWMLRGYKLDLVHFPHFNVPIFYRKKFIVTIHDLILIHFPTIKNTTLNPLFYRLKFLAYRLIINSAVRRSEKIIAVSHFTKKDILENYQNIAEDKVVVTYEACEDFCMLSPNRDDKILEYYGIIKPYLIYVGNAYPHKNLENLVRAFSSLSTKYPDLRLVFVGKEDYFYLRLKKLIIAEKIQKIIFAGHVPDYELDTLQHNAKAYVFPSLYEGFGLPPLEAMAKGTPVISSNHPCMQEILEDSAYYFNGKNKTEIAQAIDTILTDNILRKKMIAAGYAQIRKYSWKRMAKETLGIYESIKI